MRNSLLDGDMPASSYSSAGSGGSSTGGLAGYFSTDSKTTTRRTFTLCTLFTVVLIIVVFALSLALHYKGSTVIEENTGSGSSSAAPVAWSSSSTGGSGGGSDGSTGGGSDSSTGVSPTPPASSNLAANIQSAQLMTHLQGLQAAATANSGTRVITLAGFNASVDYVYSQLQGTDFILQKQYFPVERWFVNLASTSLTSYDSNGMNYTYIYGVDYQAITNSGIQGNNVENSTVVYVPNGGCNQADWEGLTTSMQGQIAIVVRDDSACNFVRKATWAINFGAIGLIIYNQENNPDLLTNLAVTQYTPIPVFLTTFQVGNGFVQASLAGSAFYIDMVLNLANTNTTVVTNIIADTRQGNISSTLVVGSHMDGVQAGPGINDNGSGTSANLAMALQVDRLIKSGQWTLPNRIRFIWFGAEEQGLLGSRYHVQQATQNTQVGERVADYAAMLNYDMLGSPNFYYGVYNASSAPVNTPRNAIPGSRILSQLHYNFFQSNRLPYDGTAFDGRSDYGQFLAVGVVAGGLFSGAEQRKTIEQRDRYDAMLGAGMGGQANAQYDSCYHQACDDIRNINTAAHLNMTRAAASVVQTLALQPNLRSYLQYPA